MNEQKISGWLLDEFISPTATLTQGDLIKFDGETDPLKQVGIVVTADCDLERKKHAKLVTLIPVVSVKVLLEHYLLPEDCERKRSQIESFAMQDFGIDSDQPIEVKYFMLKEKVENAQKLSPVQTIVGRLMRDQLNSICIDDYKILMNAIKLQRKNPKDLSQQILARGDLFILPNLAALGVGGDVAWVRHIWQVPVGNIALRTSETKHRPGERLARLDSPFRYRLTQLLAQVFSDIGLPDIPNSVEAKINEAYAHE
nr:hypothetical protein [Herbaspirillum sp. B39]